MENFWSLLKRSLHGSYVAVEPFHLFRYVDEQVFRFNNRGTKSVPLRVSCLRLSDQTLRRGSRMCLA